MKHRAFIHIYIYTLLCDPILHVSLLVIYHVKRDIVNYDVSWLSLLKNPIHSKSPRFAQNMVQKIHNRCLANLTCMKKSK